MNRFSSFVLFAEMRTGSNHLEETLNLARGLTCHGEVFNPRFVGHHDRDALFGIDKESRDADPLALLARMKEETAGLPGFRFFHDHDSRVLEAVLPDPMCAKIILTRPLLESYVSRKIAEATGQWRITDAAHRKPARVRFDSEEFAALSARLEGFKARLERALQITGQTAFRLGYSDILDTEVLNGLLRFLDVPDRLSRPSGRLKRQNPEPLHDKVTNPEEMRRALGEMGQITAEPGPSPDFSALLSAIAVTDRLLFLPLPGGPNRAVTDWLGPVETGLTRQTLRQWLNRKKRRTTFTVVSHPVTRAWRLFCAEETIPASDRDSVRAAFLACLESARTSTAPHWAPQSALLAAAAPDILPDRIFREETLGEDLSTLGDGPPAVTAETALAEIYDANVESAVRALHTPDFRAFGYRKWAP